MKKLFFLLLISCSSFSQNLKKVDAIVDAYPKYTNVEDLAMRIKIDFNLDEDKARAAFYWLATNIRYNLKEFYNPTQKTYRFRYSTEVEKQQKITEATDKIIEATFRTKRGVCEEYAQSFKKICELLHIEAVVIKGYVRNTVSEIDHPKKLPNHAWNAVKLNNKWLLLDATWAAGYAQNGKWIQKFNNYFYNIPKEKIFKTHFPSETIWVLRFGRMTIEEFYKQPIYGQQFLASAALLISPLNGILTLNKNDTIRLKFKNLDHNSAILYTFKNSKYALKPIIKNLDSYTTLNISAPHINTVLHLFMNGENALTFYIRH